jgi:cytochrome oxidase Cu insertion factor (SCO1/SenC/PrrC family)
MRILSAILLLALSALSAPAPAPRKSPEFAIQMPDGTQTLLSHYRGKVVLLAFFYTT